MPKFIDYVRKYAEPLKAIATVINPAAGVGFGIVQELFIKPKKKVEIMLEGKKTYIGISVTALAFIAQFFGYEVSTEEQGGLNDALTAVVGAFGLLFATYGRVKATKK